MAAGRTRAVEASNWTRVRSENFLIVSNAGEGEARRAAVRLEEFRALFSRRQETDNFDVSIPLTVLLFRHDSDYAFFKPLFNGDIRHDVAGYFQFSPDIKYITLSLERESARGQSSILFHEYVHALVRNSYAHAPLWFSEGAAQYYSEFELSKDGKQVTFGRSSESRLRQLASRELLPLRTLFSVNFSSSDYHEKQGVFYAQSWALVHYLLSDRSGARQTQLARYLELSAAGATVEESFRRAFKLDFTQLEGELRFYVRAARYGERVESLAELAESPPPAEVKLESRALGAAEAQAALGDLLLHTDRPADAEAYLARALKSEGNLAPAHASLGLLRSAQNRLGEAKEHLQRAIEIEPGNYLARFYYADLLRREGLDTDKTVAGYAATTRLIRAELKRVIELEPEFLEAYALLGTVDLERSPQVDETMRLLRHAAALAPKRREFELLLAQIHLRREEFAQARRLLEPFAPELQPARIRAEARTLLEKVAAGEELAAKRRADSDAVTGGAGVEKEAEVAPLPAAETLPCDMPQPGPQYKKLRFEGQQACGQLVSVECEESGVMLLVETGERTLRLRSPALSRIRFVTYTTEARGRIECGPRSNPVLVTYRPPKDTRADGELVAVEFVPADWKH